MIQAALASHFRNGHLSWKDFIGCMAKPKAVGQIPGDPLARLGVSGSDLTNAAATVEFLGLTRYLNGAKAVVTHTVDDSNEYLPACLDAIDTYGIKVTAFVTTGYQSLMPRLWPRLRQAIANGHEIGSHSRRHPCRARETSLSCFRALTWDEIDGSRKDILENTDQLYVWSWAYPCGHCADRKFIQQKIALAGYLMARAYPNEMLDLHVVPDLQTYDSNPYAARYTQVVQKPYTKNRPGKGEVTISGRTDVSLSNAKFDEVLAAGGIYSFVSHPQMIDYGVGNFYESHLAHIAGRDQVWYVPVGPLYAYRNLIAQTQVQALSANGNISRFAVFNRLDNRIYDGSITLRFRTDRKPRVISNHEELQECASGLIDRWNSQYFRTSGEELLVTVRPNTILEFSNSDSSTRIPEPQAGVSG